MTERSYKEGMLTFDSFKEHVFDSRCHEVNVAINKILFALYR